MLVNGLWGVRLAPYNVSTWTARGRELPVASSGETTLELNDLRYPVRRQVKVTNADLPDRPTTIVTVFEYVEN